MIEPKNGNILDSQCEVLVNTVNCVSTMGKGLALQFKQKFPDNYKAYKRYCDDGQLLPGHLFNYYRGYQTTPSYICNFATKDHWKNPSKLVWIQTGLKDLYKFLCDNNIHSIAIPKLGCNLGQLHWAEVKPMIVEMSEMYVGKFPWARVEIYE